MRYGSTVGSLNTRLRDLSSNTTQTTWVIAWALPSVADMVPHGRLVLWVWLGVSVARAGDGAARLTAVPAARAPSTAADRLDLRHENLRQRVTTVPLPQAHRQTAQRHDVETLDMPVARARFVLERDGDHHPAARDSQRLVEHIVGGTRRQMLEQMHDGDGVGIPVG